MKYVKEEGATAGRLAGTISSKTVRKTRTGNRMGILVLSDPSGQYEAVMFSEGLSQYQNLLETGQSVVLDVLAEDRPEDIRLRIEHVQPIDRIVNKSRHSMDVFIRNDEHLHSIHSFLKPGGEGRVQLILLYQDLGREVYIELEGKYQVTPQIASALKSIQGIVDVHMHS